MKPIDWLWIASYIIGVSFVILDKFVTATIYYMVLAALTFASLQIVESKCNKQVAEKSG